MAVASCESGPCESCMQSSTAPFRLCTQCCRMMQKCDRVFVWGEGEQRSGGGGPGLGGGGDVGGGGEGGKRV